MNSSNKYVYNMCEFTNLSDQKMEQKWEALKKWTVIIVDCSYCYGIWFLLFASMFNTCTGMHVYLILLFILWVAYRFLSGKKSIQGNVLKW